MLWLRDQMALKTLPLKLSCQGLTWKNFWSHIFLLSDTGHHNILLHIPIKRFEVNLKPPQPPPQGHNTNFQAVSLLGPDKWKKNIYKKVSVIVVCFLSATLVSASDSLFLYI